ncbi:MAG: Crp/Fnr family transcriptional regulator [Bacteriovoracaceae bacterium]|nr:Crp/Fnr family transcriptional regulator [Bacteriovoracaceae bacterium]
MKKKGTATCENCLSRMSGVFCDLENDDLATISGHKVTNVYKKGQNLFVQGNHPYGLYCVSKGNIKVSKVGADGKESIVRVVKGGDIIGHRSLFTDQNYTATATVMEDSTVCFLDKKFIMKAIQDLPSVAMNIIEKLSRDMGAAENKVSSFHQKNVRERLAELLLLLKESHGEATEDGKVKINIKLTREEMATMIGTANETLIRFISEFKDEGLIEQEGKFIVIKDEDALMEWADVNL